MGGIYSVGQNRRSPLQTRSIFVPPGLGAGVPWCEFFDWNGKWVRWEWPKDKGGLSVEKEPHSAAPPRSRAPVQKHKKPRVRFSRYGRLALLREKGFFARRQ